VGEKAESEQGRRHLDLQYPIEHGIVTNWAGLEHLWRHSFEGLRVEPALCNVMLTGNFVSTKLNKERPVEMMFERFGVYGVYVADQFQLALYSTGKTTGVVVEVGERFSLFNLSFSIYHFQFINFKFLNLSFFQFIIFLVYHY
jgi:actin-related protein